MKSFFFMDIDTQRDFMLPGGGLYVPGAERIIPRLRRLFDFARRHGITIVSSADAHTPDDPEFRQFPPHCVQGTEGQKKIDETLLPRPVTIENRVVDRNVLELIRKYQQVILQKQALDVFTNPMTERLIRALPQRAVVFGVTTEYCVRHACAGLRRLGVKTVLVTDAICALAPGSGESALAEMERTGVEFITAEMLLTAQAER
jgi:nicotinamidase/pyrazinamidase